jgi:hypothetical protein
VTMTRPSKKIFASRQAAAHSALKRQRIASSEDATEMSERQSDARSDGMLSEEEDQYPIGQPKAGWEEAERLLYGYSKTRVYKQKVNYRKSKEKIKRKREEKKALLAGIPVTQLTKPVWGDLSTMFINQVSGPTSLDLMQSFDGDSDVMPSQPANWADPISMASLEHGSFGPSLIRLYIPPNFEEAFSKCQSFKDEARDLELWIKSQNGKVTGDWLMRVECLKELLQMHHWNNSKDLEARRKDWVQFSEALARRVKRRPGWAASLRQWEQNWFETRTPPPCPRRGRHIKRHTPCSLTRGLLWLSEYLNTAMWHVSPKGVCEAVSNYLQSKNSAVKIMQIDTTLCNSQNGEKEISEITAYRWMLRLGCR